MVASVRMCGTFLIAVLLLSAVSGASGGEPQVRSAAHTPAQATPATRAQLRALAGSLSTAQLDHRHVLAVISEGSQSGQLDLAGLPIEDAVILMFELIAQDADRDMKDQLAQMEQARHRRAMLHDQQLQARQAGASAAANPTPAIASNSAVTTSRAMVVEPKIDAAANPARADTHNKLDERSEMGETEQLRLQMVMDRKAKAEQTLSNLMKKQEQADDTIINNIK